MAQSMKLSAAELALVAGLFTDYADAVDTKNWNKYQTLFEDDAVIDYSNAGGKRGTVKEIASWMEQVFSAFCSTQHLISNYQVMDRAPQVLHVKAMFHNPMSVNWVVYPRPFFQVGGWYIATISMGADGQHRFRHLSQEIAYNQATAHSIIFVVVLLWIAVTICG